MSSSPSSSSPIFRPATTPPSGTPPAISLEENETILATPVNEFFHNRASEEVLTKLGKANCFVKDIFFSSAFLDSCHTKAGDKPSFINRTANCMAKTDSAITGITSGALFLGPLPAAIIGIALLPIRFVAATLAMIVGIVASVTVATKAFLDRNPTVKKAVKIFISVILLAVLVTAAVKAWIPLFVVFIIITVVLLGTNAFTLNGVISLKSECSELRSQSTKLENEVLRLRKSVLQTEIEKLQEDEVPELPVV